MKYNAFLVSLLILISISSSDIYTQTISVMPFVSEREKWDEELKASDGVARLFTESLIKTKIFTVPDFDLLVAYFGAEDIVIPYQELATNIDIARNFAKYAFSSDYIITGLVKDFSVITLNENEIASTSFEISIIDVDTGDTITNISAKGVVELPISTQYTNYTSDDAIFTDTVLGKATTIALDSMALQVGAALNTETLKGYVVRIENDKYFIDIGYYNGISIGDRIEIYDTERIVINKNYMMTNTVDTNTVDTNTVNTNTVNTNTLNTNTLDTNTLNTNTLDTNTLDTNTLDTNTLDTNTLNTNTVDTNTLDTNTLNTNYTESLDKYGYVPIRTNSDGDIWFTSEKLYKYRLYKDKETYLATGYVVELYDKYAIIELQKEDSGKTIELLMIVRFGDAIKPDDIVELEEADETLEIINEPI